MKEGLSLHDNFIVTSLVFVAGLVLVPGHMTCDTLLVVTSVALEHGLISTTDMNLTRFALGRQLWMHLGQRNTLKVGL